MQFKIIDFHTHPKYDFHYDNHHIEISDALFKADLEANGISAACGSVIYRSIQGHPLTEYESLMKECNRTALFCREEWGHFYHPGIHVHPAFIQSSCDEITWARENGICLIGELVPYMMGWSQYSSQAMMEILTYAAEMDMVVSMHPTDISDMERVAASLPHLKIVYAHLGGYNQYDGHLHLLKTYENVYFDYSAHGSDFDGILRKTIDIVGCDRILFGTDYPGVNPASDISAVLFENLTSPELECIFHRNAEYLLHMNTTISGQ